MTIEDLNDEVSPTSEGDETAAAAPDADTGDEGSFFDAVSAAVKSDDEGSPASENDSEDTEAKQETAAPADAETEQGAATEGEQELGEVTDEELRGYHSKTRKRVKQLLDERNTAREEVDGLKDKAGRFDQVVETVTRHGLTSSEVDQGFEMMGLLVKARTDPGAAKQALEALGGYVQQLQHVTGDVLPADLAQEVQQGLISEQRAKELAASRQGQQMAQRRHEQDSEAQQQRDAAQRMNDVSTAVSKWESQWQASDPDHAVKLPLVQSAIEAAVSSALLRGDKITAQDALKIANDAKAKVDAQLATFRPKPKPVASAPNSGGMTAPTPEPASMFDVVRSAVGG